MGGMYQNFPGYAPQQHATLGLANQLGQLLNGTVVRTNPGGPVAPPPAYHIQPTSGTDPRNAGLVAQAVSGGNVDLAAEERFLRNPSFGSQGPSQLDALKSLLARQTTDRDRAMVQANINKLTGMPAPAPVTNAPPPSLASIFTGVAGGHQANPTAPSFTPPQIQQAQQAFAPPPPQAVAPPPPPAPAPAPTAAPPDISGLGALLTGLMGASGGGQVNLQNPATYSPGAGMGGFQPMQSLFASPQYSRSQPAALSSYLGRSRGY